ncbi:MAG: hypothetical protein ACFFCW_00230 [Candidatus Hodarchaeota archaeon]
MKKRLIVIAGTFDEFLHYCRENKISAQESKYVSRPEQLRGLRNCEVVYAGRYWLNKCINDPYLEIIQLER